MGFFVCFSFSFSLDTLIACAVFDHPDPLLLAAEAKLSTIQRDCWSVFYKPVKMWVGSAKAAIFFKSALRFEFYAG